MSWLTSAVACELPFCKGPWSLLSISLWPSGAFSSTAPPIHPWLIQITHLCVSTAFGAVWDRGGDRSMFSGGLSFVVGSFCVEATSSSCLHMSRGRGHSAPRLFSLCYVSQNGGSADV